MTDPMSGVDELALAVPLDTGDPEDLPEYTEGSARRWRGPMAVAARTVKSVMSEPEADPRLRSSRCARAAAPGRCPVMARARVRSSNSPLSSEVTTLPSSEHRDLVGDLHHLGELVGDEDDRIALIAELDEDSKQVLDLRRPEQRGGLVQNQDLCPSVHGLDDLHPLLEIDGQHVRPRVEVLMGMCNSSRSIGHRLFRWRRRGGRGR